MGKVIKLYAEGLTNQYDKNAVMGLAKQIHDRWCRMLFEIKTGYDAAGNFDKKYTSLKANLAGSKRARGDVNEEEDEEDEELMAAKYSTVQKNEAEIKRGRVGIIMPTRNAFDYTIRPTEASDSQARETKKSENGRTKMKKVMDGLKRANKATFSNKKMQVVKTDM